MSTNLASVSKKNASATIHSPSRKTAPTLKRCLSALSPQHIKPKLRSTLHRVKDICKSCSSAISHISSRSTSPSRPAGARWEASFDIHPEIDPLDIEGQELARRRAKSVRKVEDARDMAREREREEVRRRDSAVVKRKLMYAQQAHEMREWLQYW